MFHSFDHVRDVTISTTTMEDLVKACYSVLAKTN